MSINKPLSLIRERLPRSGDILLIHHWDTDGVSSAALISEFLSRHGDYRIGYCVPEVGTYRINPGMNIEIPDKDYAAVFMADYSVPDRDMNELSRYVQAPLFVFDHHERREFSGPGITYLNPVSEGEKGRDWPSCSWVVKKKLGLGVSDLAVLGVAGDFAENFIRGATGNFPEISEYLNSKSRGFDEYVTAKDYVDAHFKLNDRAALENLAHVLLELKGDPGLIIRNQEWGEKVIMLRKEVDHFLNQPPDEILSGRLELRKISTNKSIISEISKKTAERTTHEYVMVIDYGFFDETAQVCVRRSVHSDLPTAPFREIASSLGGKAGGKEEVSGMLIDKKAVPGFILKVREYLAQNN